jgi:hypothetical protein
LKCFQQATDLVARHKYATIYSTIPVYNFLLDMLEDKEKEYLEEDIIRHAVNSAISKLKTYYSKTDIPIYYIGTGKFIYG